MRHGFKAQAERLSTQARQALGVAPAAPLDPWLYAAHIGVVVLSFEEMEVSTHCRDQLLRADSESWSGMTIKEQGITAIVINPEP